MSSILLLGDTSGSITVAAPAVAGNSTLTLPAKTATLATQGPIFSAYKTSDSSVNGNSTLKVVMDGELYDSNGCFNNTGSTVTLNGISTPSYSFAPNVAGYYLFTASVGTVGSGNGSYNVYIVRNGNFTAPDYIDGRMFAASGSTNYIAGPYSYIFYANGTSDYFSVYFDNGINPTSLSGGSSGSDRTYFQGCFLRGA